MVVYGDLLFLINFSMDFLCFYISCRLLHQNLPTLRTCLSSIVGGVYSVISLFLVLSKSQALVIDMMVLILMCLTVYLNKETTFRKIIKGIFLYFFVSALLGGLMTALFSLFNRMEILAADMGMGEGIDVWIFAFLVIIGSLITLKGGKIFRSSSTKKIASLGIESEFGKTELCALVDSGNLVCEPISGKSVVFVNIEKCKNIIDKSMYISLLNNSNIEKMPMELLSKIRIIPTQALSGKTFLPALKFKKVSVVYEKKKKDIDVYVAFVNKHYLGEYDAIISDETII